MSLQTAHALVKGKVQGISFRAEARSLAQKLNVTGWARNTNDGAVEIMAQGAPTALAEFLQWCHKGPAAANVEEVQIDYMEPKESFTSFEVQ